MAWLLWDIYQIYDAYNADKANVPDKDATKTLSYYDGGGGVMVRAFDPGALRFQVVNMNYMAPVSAVYVSYPTLERVKER